MYLKKKLVEMFSWSRYRWSLVSCLYLFNLMDLSAKNILVML